MDQKIPFQQIQPSIYDVCIYLAFKYINIKFYLYLEGSGTSRVAVGGKCAVGGQSLKDLSKFIHHRAPLFLESLLEKYFDRISFSLSLFLSHWADVGVYKSDLAKVQPDQALTPYTPTSLGTCKEGLRKSRPL